MGRRVLLAVNERARHGRNARDGLAMALAALGHEVVHVNLDGPPSALSAEIVARRQDVDVVAVGGGDGTLLAALGGLIESRLPLVIFPLGTFNDFARTLQVPFQRTNAAELVESGIPVSLGVGRVNGHYYLNEASVRIAPAVPRVHIGMIASRGAGLAIPVFLKAVALRPRLHLEVEDEFGTRSSRSAIVLTVANNYHFAGIIENREASLKAGKLWLYAIDLVRFPDALAILAAIFTRRFPRSPWMLATSGRRFVVRSTDGTNHRVLADAEYVTDLPAEFTAIPNAITVLVPPSSVARIH